MLLNSNHNVFCRFSLMLLLDFFLSLFSPFYSDFRIYSSALEVRLTKCKTSVSLLNVISFNAKCPQRLLVISFFFFCFHLDWVHYSNAVKGHMAHIISYLVYFLFFTRNYAYESKTHWIFLEIVPFSWVGEVFFWLL